jgi:hypothetical protein
MCWNKEVSIASLIVGIIIALSVGFYALKKQWLSLALLSFGWIWVLFMQFADYIFWKHSCNDEENKKMTKMAYILNITQPLVIYLIFVTFSEVSVINKITASIIILGYLSYMFYKNYNISEKVKCIDNKGPHIKYEWWSHMGGKAGFVYTLVLSLIFILLVRPMKWSLLTLSYIILTLIISMNFFKYGVASMWCWFAVITPLVSLLFYSD